MGLYDYRHVIANERTCYWLIHRLRWPEGVSCPRCQSREIWAMREGGLARYRCKRRQRHFSLRTGTVFERSRLPLTKWVLAIGLFRVGISARSLARAPRRRAGRLGAVAPAAGCGEKRCIAAQTAGTNRGG